jgi:glyoxylase I family protein
MKTNRRDVLGILSAAAGAAILPSSSFAEQMPATGNTPLAMERVLGIGGFFFRAQEPKKLAQWYQDHLGVSMLPAKAGDQAWQQEAGPTAFAPFSEKTTYFGDATKQWMLNFRVRDLAKMAAQLEAAGVAVKIDPQTYPNGRFARIHDPEGNPIELWQPMEPKTSHEFVVVERPLRAAAVRVLLLRSAMRRGFPTAGSACCAARSAASTTDWRRGCARLRRLRRSASSAGR